MPRRECRPGSASTTGTPEHSRSVDLSKYQKIRSELEENTGDRSRDTLRIVGACRDHGLTLPEARWVIDQRQDLAERIAGRADDDIASCWEKTAPKVSRDVDLWTPKTLSIADGADRTDTGNSARLTQLAGGAARYIPKWGRWMVFTGKHWELDSGNVHITEMAKGVSRDLIEQVTRLPPGLSKEEFKSLARFATSSASVRAITAMITLARGIPELLLTMKTSMPIHGCLTSITARLICAQASCVRTTPATCARR